MRQSGPVGALVAVLVAGMVSGSVATLFTSRPAGALPVPGAVSVVVSDTDNPPGPIFGQNPSGRTVIVMNAWEYPLIPALRAEHPNALVLVYKDLTSSRPSACQNGVDQAELPTGVGYCYANALHPEWFLTTPFGTRLQENGFPDQYEMNYGSPSYQQTWLANVEADVRAHGWDGVVMDNALTKADAYGTSAEYPTDQATQGAMRSMLAVVGPGMTSAGLIAIANIGYSTEFPGLWDNWVSLLSGAENEFFLCWGAGTSDFCQHGSAWSTYEHEITDATRMGKIVLSHSGDYSIEGDLGAFEYSFASYVLANEGASAYSFAGGLTWHPEYAWQLGQPWNSYYNVPGTQLYKRDFRAGTAMVNPGPSTLFVNLWVPYMNSSGTTVSTVTIPPVSGVVLRGTNGTPSGPPPAASVVVIPAGLVNFYGSTGGTSLNKPVVGMASTPDGQGYWLVASDGGVFSFGDAAFYGSTGSMHLNRSIVGIATSADGKGYWLAASDGGVFTFGDARFHGSTGAMALSQPIVSMASTPDGQGYWLAASDGGVFSFGDATFHGSTGSMTLSQPVVSMASTPDGQGYWLVALDGGVFAFGDAGFYGSTGGMSLNQPIVAMARGPKGQGYWLGASDGGIFTE